MKQNDKNCLPDGIDTIEDKIEYVKSAYGIVGENGNLFDWLVSELLNTQNHIQKQSLNTRNHGK